MADKHDARAPWSDRSDDGVQVVAELVDILPGPLRPAGPPVAALVPEDQPAPAAWRAEIAALVVPRALVERVSMAEDDRDRRVVRPIDLGVQRHAVVSEHGQLPAAKLAERLGRGWIRAQPDSAHRHLFRRDRGADRRRRRHPRGDAGYLSEPPPPHHCTLLGNARATMLLKSRPAARGCRFS